jgi:hypothetical protein
MYYQDTINRFIELRAEDKTLQKITKRQPPATLPELKKTENK